METSKLMIKRHSLVLAGEVSNTKGRWELYHNDNSKGKYLMFVFKNLYTKNGTFFKMVTNHFYYNEIPLMFKDKIK